MVGHSVFTYEAPDLYAEENLKITKQDYENWKRQFTADALHGLRYGQSFCNFFNITNNLLYFTREVDWCDTYIKDQYLAR